MIGAILAFFGGIAQIMLLAISKLTILESAAITNNNIRKEGVKLLALAKQASDYGVNSVTENVTKTIPM